MLSTYENKLLQNEYKDLNNIDEHQPLPSMDIIILNLKMRYGINAHQTTDDLMERICKNTLVHPPKPPRGIHKNY